jgi:hypothetical protein
MNPRNKFYCQIYCQKRGGEGIAGDGEPWVFSNLLISICFESHPLRHLIFESFLRLESLRSFPTASLLPNSGDSGGRVTICVTRFDTVFTAEIAVRESNNAARASGLFFHRFFDRVNIRVSCGLEPRGVHAQHYLDAVSAKVLLDEAANLFLSGELKTARVILRDLLIMTLGFEQLARFRMRARPRG